MDKVTLDSCIFIQYPPSIFPSRFYLTAIVLAEMTAGAGDIKEVKNWNQIRKDFEEEDRLFTPDSEDWWMVGKILNSMRQQLKSPKTGKIPKHSASQTERIIRDALIARICKRENLVLVTDNLKDFKKIQPYCDIKIISGEDFFA